eukprot:TRINITY_DN6623_c0_g1_i1.p1 TRINITY_DN6623_c0_g1~~TRINITY_DN6623_c0_g1_i1.p1  ORF type:complete len:235 (+),score=30.59 TRINITY_DN6623_c0_g1_i1:281-985(+)
MFQRSYSSVDIIVICINTFFIVLGVLVSLSGIYSLAVGSVVRYLSPSPIGLALIFIGLFMMFTFFVGCVGTLSKNNCLMIIYMIILTLVIVFFVILSFISISELGRSHQILEESWNKMDNNTREKIEMTYACCGFYAPDDTEMCRDMVKENPATVGCFHPLVLLLIYSHQMAVLDFYLFHVVIGGIAISVIISIGYILSIVLICRDKCSEKEEETLYQEVVQYTAPDTETQEPE